MLHIMKIQDAPLPLFFRKTAAEIQSQLQKLLHKRRAGAHPFLLRFCRGIKIFFLQAREQILHRTAKLLRPFPLFLRDGRVLLCADPSEGKGRKALIQFRKALRAGKLRHPFLILQKGIQIHIRPIRFPAE